VRKLLSSGADPNLLEGEGFTALTIAAKKGHIEIVRLLLEAGAHKNCVTPLGTAAD
jgi:ankyrin repeat protein